MRSAPGFARNASHQLALYQLVVTVMHRWHQLDLAWTIRRRNLAAALFVLLVRSTAEPRRDAKLLGLSGRWPPPSSFPFHQLLSSTSAGKARWSVMGQDPAFEGRLAHQAVAHPADQPPRPLQFRAQRTSAASSAGVEMFRSDQQEVAPLVLLEFPGESGGAVAGQDGVAGVVALGGEQVAGAF